MGRIYHQSDVVTENFLRLPFALLAAPNYRVLSPESKLVYALLLDRMNLSQKNGWINENGEVYLIYTREDVADTLNISYKKSIAAFKELIGAELLCEKRQGRGYPNLLYVLKPDITDEDAEQFSDEYSADKTYESEKTEAESTDNMQICQNGISRTAETEYQEVPYQHIKDCQNGISRTAESAHQDMPNLHTNQIDNSNTYYIQKPNNQTDISHNSCDELTDILEKCELNTFEKRTAQMLEDAIRMLYYKKQIIVGNSELPQKEIRRILRRLNGDILIDVVEALRKNESEVRNPIGYLHSVILNSVNVDKAISVLDSAPEDISGESLYAFK